MTLFRVSLYLYRVNSSDLHNIQARHLPWFIIQRFQGCTVGKLERCPFKEINIHENIEKFK